MQIEHEAVSVRLRVIDGRKGLDRVRLAAVEAAREDRDLEVVVLYKPASRRVLNRIRRVIPDELKWRVHGAMLADQMTQTVLRIAKEESARVNVQSQIDLARARA